MLEVFENEPGCTEWDIKISDRKDDPYGEEYVVFGEIFK